MEYDTEHYIRQESERRVGERVAGKNINKQKKIQARRSEGGDKERRKQKKEALMRGGDLAMLNEASRGSVIMSGFLCADIRDTDQASIRAEDH